MDLIIKLRNAITRRMTPVSMADPLPVVSGASTTTCRELVTSATAYKWTSANRKSGRITNNHATEVAYVGGSDVTAAKGTKIAAAGGYIDVGPEDIWIMTAGAGTVRLLERT